MKTTGNRVFEKAVNCIEYPFRQKVAVAPSPSQASCCPAVPKQEICKSDISQMTRPMLSVYDVLSYRHRDCARFYAGEKMDEGDESQKQ